MDTTPPLRWGRGRGFKREGDATKHHSRGPPSVKSEPNARPQSAQKSHSPKRPTPEPSAEEEEAKTKKKLQDAEAKSGLSADFFSNMFSIGEPSQVTENKPNWIPRNTNWFKELDPEVKKEAEEPQER